MKSLYTNYARLAFLTAVCLSICATLTVPIRSSGQDVFGEPGGFEPQRFDPPHFDPPHFDPPHFDPPPVNPTWIPPTNSGINQTISDSKDETPSGNDIEARTEAQKKRAAWDLHLNAPSLSDLPSARKMRKLAGL